MPRVSGPTAPGGKSRLSELMARRSGASAPDSTIARSGTVTPMTVEDPVTSLLMENRYAGRPPRGGEYLHVSDLVNKCMRRHALVERMKLNPPSRGLTLSDALTFAQGDAIHDALRARLVRAASDRAYGRWACRCGTTVTEEPCLFSELPSTMTCPACRRAVDVYHEIQVKSETYKVTGSPDFLLYSREINALTVVELKSISHELWKDLARPVPEHVLQVAFYWYLLREQGFSLSDKASIVYATKSYVFRGMPTKEMLVDVPALVESGRLAPFLESAAQVKAARAGGALPARICQSETQTQAKNCDVCTQCFGVAENVASPKKVSFREATKSQAPSDGARPVAQQHGVRILRRR